MELHPQHKKVFFRCLRMGAGVYETKLRELDLYSLAMPKVKVNSTLSECCSWWYLLFAFT